MIAVMGATGNVGRQICERLLQNGRQVRALGRNADKLAALEARGAAAMSGEAGDAAFLASAFRGRAAVHTLLPPDLQADDLRRQHDQQARPSSRLSGRAAFGTSCSSAAWVPTCGSRNGNFDANSRIG